MQQKNTIDIREIKFCFSYETFLWIKKISVISWKGFVRAIVKSGINFYTSFIIVIILNVQCSGKCYNASQSIA